MERYLRVERARAATVAVEALACDAAVASEGCALTMIEPGVLLRPASFPGPSHGEGG